MRNILLAVLAAIIVFGTSADALSSVPSDSVYIAEVKGGGGVNSLYGIALGADILSKCKPGCRDIRLYAENNVEVPYAVIERTRYGVEGARHRLEPVSYAEEKEVSVIVFKAPVNMPPVNSLEISTGGRDFKKAVKLFGGNDGENWKELATGAFYDFSSKVNLRNTRLEWSVPVTYRYFKMVVKDEVQNNEKNAPVTLTYNGLSFSAGEFGGSKMRIDSVSAYSVPSVESATFDHNVVTAFSSEKNDRGDTVITLEANLPASTVMISVIRPGYYYRQVKVYTGNTLGADGLKQAGSGAIYNFPIFEGRGTNSAISLGVPAERYLRIVIENGSNPPLEISSVELRWIKREMFFFADASSFTYKLGVGGELEAPRYDTGLLVSRSSTAASNYTELKPLLPEKNPLYSDRGTPEKRADMEKIILTAVVLTISVVIIVWIYRLSKRSGLRN